MIDDTIAAFDRLLAAMARTHTPELFESTITMAQLKVLMLLRSFGEAPMSEMATHLGVSLSTVSGLVDRLVEGDLVQRRTDPADRRHVLVSMTAAGTEFIDRFSELGSRQLRELLGQLDDTGVATVRRAIELLLDIVSRTARTGQ